MSTKAKITVRKGVSGFLCAKCNRFHMFALYAVAQMAMGHDLTHTCECGAKHKTFGRYRYTVTAVA